MLTKGAIGNLVNRYKAVLRKCNLINTFGSLAVASMLVLGGAGVASASEPVYTNYTGTGTESHLSNKNYDGNGSSLTFSYTSNAHAVGGQNQETQRPEGAKSSSRIAQNQNSFRRLAQSRREAGGYRIKKSRAYCAPEKRPAQRK